MESGDFEAAYQEDGEEWVEQMLEDDEISSDEAAFMQGYKEAEKEGFE